MTTYYPDFGAAAGAAMEANTAMAARHTAARAAETTTRKDTQMTTSPADPVRPTDAHTPDGTLLAELRTHLAEHTPGCNAYVDGLLARSADAIARLARQETQ